jgi:hypothetical protein
MSGIVPNTTQTPNLYYDKLLHFLDLGELKTLLYAVRRTMGFHKQSDRISISQFMGGNGYIGKDGQLVEHGTGLGKAAQIKSCKSLVDFGILVEVDGNDPDENEGKEWALQLDESKIDFDALWQRQGEREEAAKERTKKATAARAATAATGTLNVPAKTAENLHGASTFNDTPPCDPERTSESAGEGYVQRTHRKKGRNKERNTDHVREENGGDKNIELTWGLLMETCTQDKEQAAAIWQLQEAFCESSGIVRPDIDTELGRKELKNDWWPVLLVVLNAAGGDLEAAKAVVKTAVTDMLAWKASAVSGPWSIRKKISGVINAQRRAATAPAAAQQNATYQHLNAVPVGKLLGM